MSEYVYGIVDLEEPRKQCVTLNGIPITARTCVTRLNNLTKQNEKLTGELEKYEKISALISSNLEYEDALGRLEEENIQLKQELSDSIEWNGKLIYENSTLTNEINMLKITIARNEEYIKRLTTTCK